MKRDKRQDTNKSQTSQHVSSSSALDDEQRVKVLSPTLLVIKRFLRNKLAIAGLIIIVFMFLFSFIGPLFSPYTETQKFYTNEYLEKPYAQGTYVQTVSVTSKDPANPLSSSVERYLLSAINKNETMFEADGLPYQLEQIGENLYRINGMAVFAEIQVLKGNYTFPEQVTPAQREAIQSAIEAGEEAIVIDGEPFTITKTSKTTYSVGTLLEQGYASNMNFVPADASATISYPLQFAALEAMKTGKNEFELDGTAYTLSETEEIEVNGKPYQRAELFQNGELVSLISAFQVFPTATDVVLTAEYVALIEEKIAEINASGDLSLVFEAPKADGTVQQYNLVRENEQFTVRRDEISLILDIYHGPSKSHWLGTDKDGMDILTRLMYGGQVSLLIGFIGVFFEVVIGIILGGLAGYFGKWVDNFIMRIVDVFNCIPTYPLLIIIGVFMDTISGITARERIFVLIIVLGLISWPGVARMVRGQILSLREQEFMTAAEASGLSTRSRIFKHLIPNVMPQLIVIATMGLGGLILTESTLSYLGLGVKHPSASWGSIINAVSNVHVMTNYWFIWIPAGLLILLTVLGFNFIGDGLRDAFDPKMKR